MIAVKQAEIDWQQEQDDLEDELYALLLLAALDGARAGLDDLPDDVANEADWAAIEAAVTDWSHQHAHELAAGITTTTQQALAELIAQGLPPEEIMARLAFLFGDARAEMIGITETTRAFSASNILAWVAAGGVALQKWNTAKDDKVCPICAPLEGQITTLGAGFADIGEPPAHPSCRCWLSPVLA